MVFTWKIVVNQINLGKLKFKNISFILVLIKKY